MELVINNNKDVYKKLISIIEKNQNETSLLNSALNYIENFDSNMYKLRGLTINKESKFVYYNGIEILLSDLEYKMLSFFFENQNKVLTTQEIFRNVWECDFCISTNLVTVYVSYLREKIDRRFHDVFIHTVYGKQSYIFK